MKKIEFIVPYICSLLVFSVYIYTGYSSVPAYRDSGDLCSAVWTLGIAHPPGYPLYIILGKIWCSLFPLASPAYRINLMSAGFAAASVFLLCYIPVTLGTSLSSRGRLIVIGTFSSLLFAFSRAVWSLAHVAEMYTLNSFIAVLIIYLVIKYYHRCPADTKTHDSVGIEVSAIQGHSRRDLDESIRTEQYNFRPWYLSGLLCGLGLGNHHTIVLLVPGLVFLFITKNKILFKHGIVTVIRQLGLILFFLFLGVTINLYLPVRSMTNPDLDWGNPETLRNLYRLLTRADYGGLRLHPEVSYQSQSLAGIFTQIYWYLRNLVDQFTLPVTIIFLVILILFFSYRWLKISQSSYTTVFLVLSLLFTGPIFIIISNLSVTDPSTPAILEPHLVLPNLVLVTFIVSLLFNKNTSRSVLTPSSPYPKTGSDKVGESSFVDYQTLPIKHTLSHLFIWLNNKSIFIIVLLIFTFATGTLVKERVLHSSCRSDSYAHDYGRNVLSTLPQDSLLYNPDDPTAFIISYFQYIFKYRPDLRVVAYFRTRWGYEQLRTRNQDLIGTDKELSSADELVTQMFDYNISRRPVYADLPHKFPPGYNPVPNGILYTVNPGIKYTNISPRQIEDTAITRANFYLSELYRYRGKYYVSQETRDFFTNHLISYYSAGYTNLGLYSQRFGKYTFAETQYLRALRIDSGLTETYNNLGTLYFQQGKYTEATRWFTQATNNRPGDDSLKYNLGLVYKTQGDLAQAERIFRSILPRYPIAGNELGLILFHRREYPAAVIVWEDAYRRNTDYLPLIYNLAMGYETVGNYTEAVKFYRLYADRIPDVKEKQEVMSLISRLHSQYKL